MEEGKSRQVKIENGSVGSTCLVLWQDRFSTQGHFVRGAIEVHRGAFGEPGVGEFAGSRGVERRFGVRLDCVATKRLVAVASLER